MKILYALCALLVLGLVTAQDCPVKPNDSCETSCKCYKFRLVNVNTTTTTTNSKTQTELTWEVTNYCKWHVSYIAFGTSQLDVIAPADGSTYIGNPSLGPVKYRVVYTNLAGNPGFESIKFEVIQESEFNNGGTETFKFTINGPLDQRYTFSLQGHGGATWETFSGFKWAECPCNQCAEECPAGFAGPTCATCESQTQIPGWTWWCVPNDSETQPYLLQLLPCSGTNCPSDGFSPYNTSKDASGYDVSCDCKRDYKECENNCLGNGLCDDAIGQCNCVTGSPPDCDVTPTTSTGGGSSSTTGGLRPCEEFKFCSGHGTCQLGKCVCTGSYTGENCDVIPPSKCRDFETCEGCIDFSSNCTWCTGPGGAPICSDATTCQPKDLIPACKLTYIDYTPEPCPDNCKGNGKCVDNSCVCNDGWTGLNCGEEALTTEEIVAVASSAALIAIIVAAVVAGLAITGGGGYGIYKYAKMNGKLDGAQSNPLYVENPNKGTNPFYDQTKDDKL